MSSSITPIPLILITGFLGSGKTTLLNALLRHGDMSGTAVLMNEIGAVGIDHSLVVGASDDILLLEGGCLCCQPKGSVADGVSRLLQLDPIPKRIIIETSGGANPLPVLESLSQHPAAATGFQFPRVVAVIDSVFGQQTLEQHPEAGFQLAAADIVIMTKTDLASPDRSTETIKIINGLNPSAILVDEQANERAERLVELLDQPTGMPGARIAEHQVHGHAAPAHTEGRNGAEFETAALQFDGCLDARYVQEWLDQVLDLYANNLLRIKGILLLRDHARPAVLQCVRDIVHPIEQLDAGAAGVEQNSIVAIGWDIHPDLLREALQRLADGAVQR